MTPRIRSIAFRVASLAAMLSLPVSHLGAQDIGPPAPPAPADVATAPAPVGVEVMTRGVVHEAFAEVVTDPKPGLMVSKRPPEAIQEVPPEFKPDDEGAIWITGYWAWDDERDDFFWQSGVWRVPPPGMRWVAGYWNEVLGGWQWVSGFWVPVETEEIRYYAAPPASLEVGPSSPAPGDNYFWATGSWNYYDTGYRWQPGYWAPYQENWVWISPRYVWTPAGCVYLPGRWDYRLTRRGCLFAPVYFAQPIYLQPNYVYRPWCALNTPNLFVHLWVRPNYCHFYFGNYYGSNWGNWGVTPWCQYQPYRNCYDPMLTQLQCHYRQQGVNYINRLDGWHNHYASNVASRPPQTWNEQVRIVNNTNINNTNITNTNITNTNITNIKQNFLAVNLQDAARRNDLPVKFARVDGNMQKQAINLAKETRDVRQQRISVERPAVLAADLTKGKGGKRDGNKPDLSQRAPSPGVNDQLRLKLPVTHVADIVKQKEKLAPPKLAPPKLTQPNVSAPNVAQPRADLPGDLNKRRGEGRGQFSRPQPAGVTPQPKRGSSDSLPKSDAPKSQVERTGPEPRNPRTPVGTRTPDFPSRPIPPGGPVPRPGPDGNFPAPTTPGGSRSTPGGTRTPDFPSRPIPPGGPVPRAPLPRTGGPGQRLPAPGPGAPALPGVPGLPPQPKVEMPQPKLDALLPRIEPKERPQIKLDIPKPTVKPDSAPRLQPNPGAETPRLDTSRLEPRRGGEKQPRGGRNKPE